MTLSPSACEVPLDVTKKEKFYSEQYVIDGRIAV